MRGALVPPGLFDTACRGWAKPSVGLVTVCLGTWEHCVRVLTYAVIGFPCNGCVCVCPAQCVRGLLLWFVIGGTAARASQGHAVCQGCASRHCFLPMSASAVRRRPIVRAVVLRLQAVSCFVNRH